MAGEVYVFDLSGDPRAPRLCLVLADRGERSAGSMLCSAYRRSYPPLTQ